MTSNHGPEDQPFNPEDVVRANSSAGHNRASSSATLLHDEGAKGDDMFPGYSPQYPDAGYNYTHYGGPSEYNLVDKQEFNNPKLHDLGESLPILKAFAQFAHHQIAHYFQNTPTHMTRPVRDLCPSNHLLWRSY